MDKQKLIKASKAGDDDAFYQLIVENKEKLYKIAYSYLRNEEDALEAIQEVTCRAYMRFGKLKEDQYFDTWLVRIMINYCIDELKKKSRFFNQEINLNNSKIFRNDEDVINYNQYGLQPVLDEMEPKIRSIIELKYFHDFTITEIARTIERPEGTVKTWLNKGLKVLRSYLEKEGD
ncbi:sigma-70 family RNA polymerase sigma factor [Bacillus sp. 31A1R]|uniref:Sigma-70 family RNA polymerase sigma factor n=1 Tax=Robertmurraya mangrovi TaxID=3098077 RepID=A0ABU5J4A1_9BACI|nr:sigma-70 family RNA polymerase sigma factor [Bacillus sp. 31A1R]MDZ5474190.1 sigma-70 family RNA polymerase sigma factor [Bacillus sp. 31A1R]